MVTIQQTKQQVHFFNMYKLDVGVDTREAAAIERRKNMEKQRKSRIFNARERTIGVGLQAVCVCVIVVYQYIYIYIYIIYIYIYM